MKKILLLGITVIFALTSCEKNTNNVPQEVDFTVSFGFVESGSMTKSGESKSTTDAYTNFYNAYVKTKILTPDTYSLTFSNESSETAYTINGNWDNKDMVKLPEGTYTVTGSASDQSELGKLVALSFNEEVVVSKSTADIQLTASYDCYLLMFDKTRITSATYKYTEGFITEVSLYSQDEGIFYIFLSTTPQSSYYPRISYIRENSSEGTIYLSDLGLLKGYYYYFNDISGGFDIPPMLGN